MPSLLGGRYWAFSRRWARPAYASRKASDAALVDRSLVVAREIVGKFWEAIDWCEHLQERAVQKHREYPRSP